MPKVKVNGIDLNYADVGSGEPRLQWMAGPQPRARAEAVWEGSENPFPAKRGRRTATMECVTRGWKTSDDGRGEVRQSQR